LDGEGKRFAGEKYDTVGKALELRSRGLIFHCSDEMVHISHGRLLEDAMSRNNRVEVNFCEIADPKYEHRSAPSFLGKGWVM
jgi:hypothetical protein